MKLKHTEEVFAMKILNKWEMLKRAEVSNHGNPGLVATEFLRVWEPVVSTWLRRAAC